MTMKSKFAGKCSVCNEKFPAGTEIEWTRGGGARHATINQCTEAKKAAVAARGALNIDRPVLDLKPIVKFLQDAQERGLKKPKLRVLDVLGVGELRLGLTRVGVAPGSLSVVHDKVGYVGSVRPSGEVIGPLAVDMALQKHLVRIAENPAAAAKEYAAMMCRCSFCGLPLTDAGSVEVGYGPICAQRWGLPHSPKGTPTLHPLV